MTVKKGHKMRPYTHLDKVGTKRKKTPNYCSVSFGRIEWTRKERSDGIANKVSVTESTIADTNTNTA